MTNVFRDLLRSNAVLAGAQVAQIALSLLRMKMVAVLLGPAGVGLLGAYNSLQSLAVTAAGLGMASSGVKQIASASSESESLIRARVVLFSAHLIQGLGAFIAVTLLSSPISVYLTGSAEHAWGVAVVGGSALLSLLASSQTALLQGLRRSWDLARITLIGGLTGTACGLLAIWFLRDAGLVIFLLVQPVAAVLTAVFFIRRLSLPPARRVLLVEYWSEWRALASLGFVFMLGGLTTTATLFFVRAQIAQELSLEAAGYFTAAWGISSQAMALLLVPLASDYYPRLSAAAADKAVVSELSNAQTQLILSIGGPFLLILLGLAPIIIQFLYSVDFYPAAVLLQWLALGGLFKLASWPLSFILIAKGNGRTFLAAEVGFNVAYGMFCWLGLPHFGLVSAAQGFATAYALYFVSIAFLVRRLHDVRNDATSVRLTAALIIPAVLAAVFSEMNSLAAGAVAVSSGIIMLGVGVRLIIRKTDGPPLRSLLDRLRNNRR